MEHLYSILKYGTMGLAGIGLTLSATLITTLFRSSQRRRGDFALVGLYMALAGTSLGLVFFRPEGPNAASITSQIGVIKRDVGDLLGTLNEINKQANAIKEYSTPPHVDAAQTRGGAQNIIDWERKAGQVVSAVFQKLSAVEADLSRFPHSNP
jgi:hypothetical protein